MWRFEAVFMIIILVGVVDQGVSVKLSGNLVSNGDVSAFSLSSNGAWAVYRADELINTVEELFSVPPDGSVARIRISKSGVTSGFRSVQEFSISPNSQTVVYRAAHGSNSAFHAYATPIDGSGNGAVIQLDADGLAGTVVEKNSLPVAICAPCAPAFLITPDSSTVLYRADRLTDLVFQIFSVPINGPRNASITLSHIGVNSMLLAMDGAVLIYKITIGEFFTVPVDGSASETQITSGLPGEQIQANWKVSPEGVGNAGSRIAYVVRNATTSADTLRSIQLPFAGSSSVSRLSQDPRTATNGQNINIKNYVWASDGLSVFFTADPNTNGLFDLYVSPWDASSPPVALTNMAASTSSSGVQQFQVSPDDSRVVYIADSITAGVSELFSVSSLGPASSAIKISGIMDANRDVISSWPLQFTPDSVRVIYGTDQESLDDEINIWVTLVNTASGPIRLSPLATLFPGPLDDLKIPRSNSRFAIYRGSLEESGRRRLTAVGLISGESSATDLNTPLNWSGGVLDIDNYGLTTDDLDVVYISDHVIENTNELFSTIIPASIVNDGGGGGSGTTSSSSSASRFMPMTYWKCW